MSEFVSSGVMVNLGCIIGNCVERLTITDLLLGRCGWWEMGVSGRDGDIDGKVAKAVVGKGRMQGDADVCGADVAWVVREEVGRFHVDVGGSACPFGSWG